MASTIGMNHDHPTYRKLHPPPAGGQFHPIDEIPERDVLGGAREGAGSLRSSSVVLHCIAWLFRSDPRPSSLTELGFLFLFWVVVVGKRRRRRRNNMGRNNDGKGDVIALFDVDGTLTYPRLVNSVFFAASFLFLVFFFPLLLLLVLSPRLHLASTVLCERSWNCVVWQ